MIDALQFRVGLDMREAERGLIEFRTKAEHFGRALGTLKNAALGIGASLGAGMAAGAAALNSIVQTGGQLEAFESRLVTLMGSSSQAKARLGELFDFAASTPFELDQVVGAEVTLRGFGAAAEELMPGLIDFAAVTGTDLPQAALDFGKAWAQGATGLESDGAKILRQQIEIRTGLDATKMGIEDFRAAMLDTLSEGMFAGGAARLSQTFTGMVSNLTDEWTRFKLEVADAGVFQNIKGALSVTLDLISQNRDTIREFAAAVSGGLWQGFKIVAVGVGVIVDQLRLAGAVLDGVTVATAGWAMATLDAAGAVTKGFAAMAAATGQDGIAGALTVASQKIGELRAGAEAMGTAAADSLVGFLGSESAANQIAGWLTEAEARAKGMAGAVEEMRAGAGGKPGEDGGKADTSAQDALLREFEAAQEFSEQMKALGRSETEALMIEYARRMQMLLDYQANGMLVGQEFADARLAIERDYAGKVEAMEAEQDEKRRDELMSKATYTMGVYSSLLGAIEARLEEGNERQKAAAKKVGIAQVVISTAAGVMKAFEQFGWPYGLIPAAAVVAQGAIAGSQIASAHQGRTLDTAPTYAHQGRGPAPDEVDVRTLRSESVLNTQATRRLGEQGVNALNGGASPTVKLDLTIGRRQQREIFREEQRLNGGYTRRFSEMMRSGEQDAGWTGETAFA